MTTTKRDDRTDAQLVAVIGRTALAELAARLAESRAEVDALDRVVQARLRMDTHEADNEAAQMLEDSRMEQQSASDYAIAESDYEAALLALAPKEES